MDEKDRKRLESEAPNNRYIGYYVTISDLGQSQSTGKLVDIVNGFAILLPFADVDYSTPIPTRCITEKGLPISKDLRSPGMRIKPTTLQQIIDYNSYADGIDAEERESRKDDSSN